MYSLRPALIVALLLLYQSPLPGQASPASVATYDYDLDSLVYLSSGVVEGRFIAPDQVRITRVHSGALQVGDTVAVDGTHLSNGDGAFIFYTRPRLVLGIESRERSFQFAPLPGGMKIVIRGQVDGMYDYSGSYLSYPPPNSWNSAAISRGSTPTVREYREAVRMSVARAAKLHARLDRPAEAKDVPWLVALLKERYVSLYGATNGRPLYETQDAIAAEASKKLLELEDVQALDDGLLANPAAWALLRGFDTRKGREFLLTNIGDRKVPLEHRRLLARAFGDGTGAYRARDARSTTLPSPAESGAKAPSYLTRVAELAAATALEDDELTTTLLKFIGMQSFWMHDQHDAQIDADVREATLVLRGLYGRTTTSDYLRYRIEEAMVRIGDGAYESLRSKCGPMLTLAEREDETRYTPQGVPGIVIGYSFQGVAPVDRITHALFVLEPAGGGKGYFFPSGMTGVQHAGAGTGGGGSDFLALPGDIAPGRYHIFYRLMNGEKIVSEGHGFETAIPLPPFPRPARERGALPDWILNEPAPPIQIRSTWIKSTLGGAIAFAVVLVAQAFIRGRRSRRWARRGLCPDCGYDLRASTGRCSECGRLISKDVGAGVVLRRLLGIVRAGAIVVCVMMIALWVRSYWAADCVTRTNRQTADALYSTRGALVLGRCNTDASSGWIYEHDKAAAFPRSASETVGLPGWRVLGFEHSPDAGLTIVPFWAATAAAAMVAALCRRANRAGRHRITGVVQQPA
ncbi:MAG: hypothetical protein JWN51_946 [Phycisphaerales bacterium]|nr:hypothetical protein [Phycisphaerales bacterium]